MASPNAARSRTTANFEPTVDRHAGVGVGADVTETREVLHAPRHAAVVQAAHGGHDALSASCGVQPEAAEPGRAAGIDVGDGREVDVDAELRSALPAVRYSRRVCEAGSSRSVLGGAGPSERTRRTEPPSWSIISTGRRSARRSATAGRCRRRRARRTARARRGASRARAGCRTSRRRRAPRSRRRGMHGGRRRRCRKGQQHGGGEHTRTRPGADPPVR